MFLQNQQIRGALRPVCIASALLVSLAVSPVSALVSPFQQAVAEAAANDSEIAEFYRTNAYRAIWTGTERMYKDRRAAFMQALEQADDHALPVSTYNIDTLKKKLRRVGSQRELGQVEVALSQLFIRYAHDLQSGVLAPSEVDEMIDRKASTRSGLELLSAFSQSNPERFLRELQPVSVEYARLLKAKIILDRHLAEGGWGPTVAARKLRPGQSGADVAVLRNRLVAMGYMERSAVPTYDARLQVAIRRFQIDNGLTPDGIADPETMIEINRQVEDRIGSVAVALERERWMNLPRGERHIWANLTDFSVAIIDSGEITFQTRSVIGQNTSDRQSPEFSDVMEYMEINPSWYVPQSIAIGEFLPQMISTAGDAERQFEIVTELGEVVDRSIIDWAFFEPKSFPFGLRQAPGPQNALGYVKFMFPNRHNIYLHDTPERELFDRETRDFSHGCIRLASPYEFAYEILRRQVEEPVSHFHEVLESGEQTNIDITEPIPVHIVYRTAFTSPEGRLNFRRDIYGRDARIIAALGEAGVALAEIGT